MRVLLLLLSGLTLFALPASAVVIDWVDVGAAGNACDLQAQGCFGAVAYDYRIGQDEVTNAQYAEFLNAVAATDTNALYNPGMALGVGGITQSGSSGSFTYSTIAGRESRPVNLISFYDALRFANWMHNGQPTGAQDDSTTEDGSYTITAQGIADNSITRNVEATIVLPSEDEWYKAAYYDGGSVSYFAYPAISDTQPACAAPGATANTANCSNVFGDLTDGGAYTGAASPFGSFDQGGNVAEWNEGVFGTRRVERGGSYNGVPIRLRSSVRTVRNPASTSTFIGFRVAAIAEPTPSLLPMGIISFNDDALVPNELMFGAVDVSAASLLNLDEGSLFFAIPGLVIGSIEDINAAHALADGSVVFSTITDVYIDSVRFRPGDLIHYDPLTGLVTLFFDMNLFSQVENIDAVYVFEKGPHAGKLLLSTRATATLGGLVDFGSGDLVRYNPANDVATLYPDQVPIVGTAAQRDIDAVHLRPNGNIVFTALISGGTVGGLTLRAQDVVEYDPVADVAVVILDGDGLYNGTTAHLNAVTFAQAVLAVPSLGPFGLGLLALVIGIAALPRWGSSKH